MAEIQLSICIPTYNRASLLTETLASVLAQMRGEIRGIVEIVVSDNASEDGTPDVVARTRERNPDIRFQYFRQDENRGPDANIYRSMTLATGDYVVVLSDDDLLLPGALCAWLTAIREHPEAGLFCNNTIMFETEPAEGVPTALPVSRDGVVEGRDAVVAFLGKWLTFLSQFVIRGDLFRGNDYSPRIGSFLLQCYIYLDSLVVCDNAYILSEPVIAVRANNTGGYSFFQVFVTHYLDLLRYAAERGYSAEVLADLRVRHLRQFIIPFILSFKTRGRYGSLRPDYWDAARRLFRGYGLRPELVFVVIPLLATPAPVLRAARALKRRAA